MYQHKLLTFIYFCSNFILSQQSFEKYQLSQQKKIDSYEVNIDSYYLAHKEKEKKEYNKYRENIEREWNQFKESTSVEYVSYDDDFLSRSIIDFENGYLTVEVIVKQEEVKTGYKTKLPKNSLNKYLEYKLSSLGKSMFLLNNYLSPFSSQTADHIDREFSQMGGEPLFNKLAKNKLFKKLIKTLKEKEDGGNFILENQINDGRGGVLNLDGKIQDFAKEVVENNHKESKSFIGKDGKERTSFSFSFKLNEKHKNVRSKKYGEQILKQSKRFNIDPAIAMAITETESSFNPKATSHIPAYGLMQLVPSSGGRDAYQYVYKKDKFLKKSYLYKPDNNIELGCAYLSKIRYVYFKGISDEEKAMICTIAAYNTGAGNVCRAISNTTKLGPSIKKINKMSSNKLYNTLINDLKYDETKKYLKKVWNRKEKYKS